MKAISISGSGVIMAKIIISENNGVMAWRINNGESVSKAKICIGEKSIIAISVISMAISA